MPRTVKNASPETLAAAGMSNGSGPTLEIFDAHLRNVRRHRNGPLALAKAAFDAAKKEDKRLKGLAKNDGIALVPFEEVIKKLEMEDEVKASENASTLVQYFQWAGLLEGEQGELFTGSSPTPSENAERWYDRGFRDIRDGKLDPEGYTAEDGTKSAQAIMINVKPSYVPAEFYSDWAKGAHEADQLNNEDALRILSRGKNTPIEKAANTEKAADAAAATEDEFAGDEV